MERPEFTGERMIPDACEGTSLELEHVARYRLAARFARGKRVLDAATGVGYGAAMLADAGAALVVGIDTDPATIAYAAERYRRPNVRFEVDDVTLLASVADASIDLFVSFETIEHIDRGEDLIRQAARVLAPEGIAIVSTPNWEVSRCQNPFHRREYRRDEIVALLRGEFPNVRVLHQRTFYASRIGSTEAGDRGGPPAEPALLPFEGEPPDDTSRTPYFIALASRASLPAAAGVVHLGEASDTEEKNQHLQRLEAGVGERDRSLEQLAARVAAGVEAIEDAERRGAVSREAASAADRRAEAAAERAWALEAERETRNRYIQNLEGGVGERDARIRDLEISLDRRETRFALLIVRWLIRANRLLGRVPSRVARKFLRARRIAAGAAPPPPEAQRGPYFSLVVPVYQNADYLEASIESAVGQTFADYEVLLYDDASPDPRVREILARYAPRAGVTVRIGDRNLGISGATNAAIALASGRYVAFLDCDDVLEPNALERVARRLDQNPEIEFLYTNRVDVDDSGRVVERWDFTNRSLGRPEEELLKGMFASHLKVIRRDAFQRAGLFRGEFDTVQDYDLALRLSERCRTAFLGEAVYRHRVHPNQATQTGFERQKALAERAKERALLRRRIAAGGYEGLVSIVILSLNRPEETAGCLDAIERHTPFRHEIVLVDNGSQPAALAKLRAIVSGRERVALHEMGSNLGVGGGRNHGASLATGDYLVFLDNDIEVGEGWLAHLLTEMEADRRLAACCCRVVFPDGTVQFTGGGTKAGARRVRFELLHTGRPREDLATLEQRECDWVPGGATIFRKPVFDAIPYDTTLEGAYEDNDWSIAARRAGHLLGNAPLATVVHHHMNYSPSAQNDDHYRLQRYDKGKLERTLRRFHRKHGLFIDEEDLYRYLGYSGSEAFIESALAGHGGRA